MKLPRHYSKATYIVVSMNIYGRYDLYSWNSKEVDRYRYSSEDTPYLPNHKDIAIQGRPGNWTVVRVMVHSDLRGVKKRERVCACTAIPCRIDRRVPSRDGNSAGGLSSLDFGLQRTLPDIDFPPPRPPLSSLSILALGLFSLFLPL